MTTKTTTKTTMETEENVDIGTLCKSTTYVKGVGCKNLYITVCYKEDGKIDYFLLDGRGDNECGKSWLQMTADLLSFCVRRIRNKYEALAIIKLCKHHRCNKFIASKATSCADAISQVLEEVLKIEEKETEETSQAKADK